MCLLGMHRSGTSVASRMMNLLGVHGTETSTRNSLDNTLALFANSVAGVEAEAKAQNETHLLESLSDGMNQAEAAERTLKKAADAAWHEVLCVTSSS